MSSTLPRVDDRADAELISAVRGGDLEAYGELFARHSDAATRLGRQLMSSSDADDLVSEAFAKVLIVLQRGGGPDMAFRAYLLTSVRRLHVDKIRAGSRLHTTDDLEPFDPGVPFQDTAVAGFENEAAAKAFASLPERWQLVLWHLEVEGQKPADIAPLLGMSANSVSALAYRAREGLRQAFLNQHAQELDDDTCQWTHQHLGAYIRNGISRRDASKVEEHLDECRKCMAVYLELSEVNSNLAGILGPLLLGTAATAYLATAGGLVAKGGLLVLVGRARDAVLGNLPAAAVAGVAATAVIAGTTVAVIASHGEKQVSSADKPAGVVSSPGTTDHSKRPRKDRPVVIAPRRSPSDPALPSDIPTVSDSPSESPSQTTEPSDTTGPSESPTRSESPTESPTQSESTSESPTESASSSESSSPTESTSPSESTSESATESPTDPTSSATQEPLSKDIGITASAQLRDNRSYVLTSTIAGLAPGDSLALDMRVGGNLYFHAVPWDGCAIDNTDNQHLSCTVTQDADTVAPIVLRISSVIPSETTTVSYAISPLGDTLNEDTTNDTASVDLNPVFNKRGFDKRATARGSARTVGTAWSGPRPGASRTDWI